MRAPTRRDAATAVEILIASAIFVAAILPIYTLIQESQRVAYLDEFHVLARRRARRAFAVLGGHPYHLLREQATGEAPPGDVDRRLSPASREIFVPIPSEATDVTMENIPAVVLDDYLRRAGAMPVHVYFEELNPGFARLAVLVSWVDPSSKKGRHLVMVRFVEDPFRWSRP